MKLSIRSDIVDDINKLLSYTKDSEGYELEFRFGRYTNRFNPGIKYSDYNKLLVFCREQNYTEIENISNVTVLRNRVRKMETDNDIKYVKKKRIKKIDIGDFFNYFLRLDYALEENILKPHDTRIIEIRYRIRNTFMLETYKIELTKLNNKYEVEIEFLTNPKSLQELFEPVKKIYSIIGE